MIRLTIVTPEKPALTAQANFVCLPAKEGEMGVLSGHAPCAVLLGEGVLRYKSPSEEGEFAVMGGFAEIFKDEILVFAEQAEMAQEIDIERAKQDAQKAKAEIAAGGKMDLDAANVALRRALVRMKLAQRPRRHRASP
ncbi:MAG: ATP synthase F1 subunit epsilon [Elusimicrobia bacterium]|nr:ATP synthase F1 subunit epsilon [Elusimicrobiota bacterium]